MKIVDEMFDNGFDRMLKSIADLDSKIDTTSASLRSEMAKEFTFLRSDMDARFSTIDERFNATNRLILTLQALLPFASAVITVGFLVALASIVGDWPKSRIWLI